MAEYKNEALGVKFSVPDTMTVGQNLRYRGRVFNAGFYSDDVYIRMWQGFLSLYQEWECDLIANPKDLDVDIETNPQVANIVMWVGNMTAHHVNVLEAEAVPKN
jgi:hypothetical protein